VALVYATRGGGRIAPCRFSRRGEGRERRSPRGDPELPTAKSDSSTTKSESTPKVMTSTPGTARSTGSDRGIRRRTGRAVGWPRTLGIDDRPLAPIAKERRLGWPRRSIRAPDPASRTGATERPASGSSRRSSGRARPVLFERSAWARAKGREVIYRLPGGRFLRELAGWLLRWGMPPQRPGRIPPPPSLPRRGRHPLGLARIALRRVAVPRHREHAPARAERRREQLPLPPGFVDRRSPRA
jgi:hypothetical protein